MEKAKTKKLKDRLVEKYEKRELDPAKRAVLEGWVREIDERESQSAVSQLDEKQKKIIGKLVKEIEQREALKGRR